MPRWAFPLQIYFLNSRFQQALEIAGTTGGASGRRGTVLDRTIYEDAHVFARNLRNAGLLSARDHATYLRLYQSMLTFVRPPDLLIYLRARLPRLREGIRRRGRPYERNIPDDYLLHLNQLYETWIEQYRCGPLLVVEADDLDFVANQHHQVTLLARVAQALPPAAPPPAS